jgi:hypothetical protein
MAVAQHFGDLIDDVGLVHAAVNLSGLGGVISFLSPRWLGQAAG